MNRYCITLISLLFLGGCSVASKSPPFVDPKVSSSYSTIEVEAYDGDGPNMRAILYEADDKVATRRLPLGVVDETFIMYLEPGEHKITAHCYAYPKYFGGFLTMNFEPKTIYSLSCIRAGNNTGKFVFKNKDTQEQLPYVYAPLRKGSWLF